MIRLLLLLIGAEAIRRRWSTLFAAGCLWAGAGLFIFVDSLDEVTLIPVRDFGYLLIVEAVFFVLIASQARGGTRRLRLVQGALLLAAGLLTVDAPWRSDVALALLLGIGFAIDGALTCVAAHVIRYPGWRSSQVAGLVSLALAVGTLQPWPTWYVGTIGCNIGLALILSGAAVVRLALRIRGMPADAPVSLLLSPAFAWVMQGWSDGPAVPGEMVVHVWTPAVGGVSIRRPLLDRYIAAVSPTGAISTGHAALEMPPDLYISHYPAAEIDRSPGEFRRTLRATPDNDVPGRFLPSYADEAGGWCEANAHVRFRHFDARRLRAFWTAYRQDTTYNLTHRNCSSAVAHALDAALEGRLVARGPMVRALLGAVIRPELWIASMLRARAETMAWTPGLVLDYARALSALLDPPETAWYAGLARLQRMRRGGEC